MSRYDNDITPVPYDKSFVPEGSKPVDEGKKPVHTLPEGVVPADSNPER